MGYFKLLAIWLLLSGPASAQSGETLCSANMKLIRCSVQNWDLKKDNGITVVGTVNANVTNATPSVPLNWRLVIRRVSGEITVTHFATEADCNTAKQAAEHVPITPEEKAYAAYFDKQDRNNNLQNRTYMTTSGDIQNIECLDW